MPFLFDPSKWEHESTPCPKSQRIYGFWDIRKINKYPISNFMFSWIVNSYRLRYAESGTKGVDTASNAVICGPDLWSVWRLQIFCSNVATFFSTFDASAAGAGDGDLCVVVAVIGGSGAIGTDGVTAVDWIRFSWRFDSPGWATMLITNEERKRIVDTRWIVIAFVWVFGLCSVFVEELNWEMRLNAQSFQEPLVSASNYLEQVDWLLDGAMVQDR